MSRSRRRTIANVDLTKDTSKVPATRAPAVVAGSVCNRITISLLCLVCAVLLYYAWPSNKQMHENHVVLPSPDMPFKVVELPGKGKGIIAARDIQQGECLIREKPLFLVPNQISSSPIVLLTNLLVSLSQAERASFFDLSSNRPADAVTSENEIGQLALSIFETNAVAAGDRVGIFPRMARLNHGCSRAFNSVYSWREQEGVIVVHALKPVKNGSELLTTYTNTRRSRTERREFLQNHYHFQCACEVCSLPESQSRRSDERLTTMTELYGKLASWTHGSITGPQAIHLINQIWTIGEEEEYWSERGQLAADAVLVAVAHSDAGSASRWASLSVEWFGYELGNDSLQALGMTEMIHHPQSHPSWASRDRTEVGGPSV